MDKLIELEKKLKEYRELLDKASKDHDDEKEDKELIAEAIDEHNEKKHGEAKDKDSAFKEETLKSEEITIGQNGQWKIGTKHVGSDIPYTDKDHDKKEDAKSESEDDE